MQLQPVSPSASSVLAELIQNKRRKDWMASAGRVGDIPAGELGGPWLPVADEVAFALGQLHRTDEAASLLGRAFAVEPTRRRASALAYLYYNAALAQRRPAPARGPVRDAEADRAAFIRWIQEALSREPGSVKDLYRLGVFEAQVQSHHDAVALRAFERAIRSFKALSADEHARRPDLQKPYHRCLYAAARSAFRLGRFTDARRYIFACIRDDRLTHHVEELYKLFLAGKVCAVRGEFEHAERAFRLALDAQGPRERSFVYLALASAALKAGQLQPGAAWIEQRVPPHRRSAAMWRLLGDIRVAQQRSQEARMAYENALMKDRGGRHLTLDRLGRLHLAAHAPGKARKCFEQSTQFRQRHYLSEHRPALEGLIEVARILGDAALMKEASSRVSRLDAASRRSPGHDAHDDDLPDDAEVA